MKHLTVVLALVLAAATAEAGNAPPPPPQPSPTLPAWVGLPWGLGVTGASRNVWIEPRTVVVDTVLEVPAAPEQAAMATSETEGGPAPAPRAETTPQYAVWRQTAVVPGYWVREVSTGVFYPQRWTLEQTFTGYYQWRLLPAEFRPR